MVSRQTRYKLLPAKDELFGDLPPPTTAAPPPPASGGGGASGGASGSKRIPPAAAAADAAAAGAAGGGGGGEGAHSDGGGDDAEHARKRRRTSTDVTDVNAVLAKLKRHVSRGPVGDSGGAFGKAVELLASLMASHMSRENAPAFLDVVGDAIAADDGSAAGNCVRVLLTQAANSAVSGVVRGGQLPLLTAWALRAVTARELRSAEDNYALASGVRVVRAAIDGFAAPAPGGGDDDALAARARAAAEDGVIACLAAMTAKGGAREWARGATDSTVAAAAAARLSFGEAARARLDEVVAAWRAPRVAHTRMVVHGAQMHPMTRVMVRVDAPSEAAASDAAAAAAAAATTATAGAGGGAV
jgi:hypothetical protein